MSDTAAEAARAALRAHIGEHLATYLRSGGAQGHVIDGRASGAYLFGTTCLIRYTGRKSGRTMITPLSYADRGGEVIVVGSRGGSAAHPAWYLNLVAAGRVDFQIATQAFRATWREPEGAERWKIWDFMVDCYPFYAAYQTRTSRQIPLVMMQAIEAIPVFREADLTGVP
ncbi:MAG: nitroreductase family deazaflavin-dependent oxidoreductase [Sphingomonadales bacterium]|nr:nitroreductase family deazaflavin-dependent oxidoreductase [Sphingomonadales bacterium]